MKQKLWMYKSCKFIIKANIYRNKTHKIKIPEKKKKKKLLLQNKET